MDVNAKKKEVYVAIYEAQEADAVGDFNRAYDNYLKGVNILSGILLAKGAPNNAEIASEVKQAVSMLRKGSERLDELVAKRAAQPHLQSNHLLAKSTSVVAPIATLQRQFGTSNQLTPPVVSAIIQKASRDNALLAKIYEARISRCADARSKATLQMELQRRMSENMVLARKKEAEEAVIRQRNERDALETAARKLLNASIDGRIDSLKEVDSGETQFNPQILYARVLQYEAQNQAQSIATPSQLSAHVDAVFRNARHPLSRWLIKFQHNLVDKVDPLLAKYLTKVSEKESSDLIHDFTESTEEELRSLCENRVITQLEAEALERHLEIITSDLKMALELLMQMFSMEVSAHLSESDHETLALQICDHIYTPIWNRVYALFSIVYSPAENAFRAGAQSMLINKSSDELHDELSAGFSGDNVLTHFFPRDEAENLRGIATLINPYRKLKLLTRFVKELCNKVTTQEQIGADQLIPMLVLVLLNCGMSKIVIDCEAIEQLAPGRDLLGQEGYCLSSFSTSIKYIEMHGRN